MQRTARFFPKRAMEALTRHAGDGANRSILALNAVCCETALRLKLRDEPTLRGRRKSVVRDPVADVDTSLWNARFSIARRR